MLSNEINHLKNYYNQQEIQLNSEISEIASKNENLKTEILKLTETINKNPEEKMLFDANISNFNNQTLIEEQEILKNAVNDKDTEILLLKEECHKLEVALYEKNFMKGSISEETSKSQFSESSSISYRSVHELLLVELISDINIKTNPLIQITTELKKEPPMIYSNL